MSEHTFVAIFPVFQSHSDHGRGERGGMWVRVHFPVNESEYALARAGQRPPRIVEEIHRLERLSMAKACRQLEGGAPA